MNNRAPSIKKINVTPTKIKLTLIVIDGLNKNVYLSARNLKKSEVVSDSEISTYKIMNAQHLVIEEKAIEKIESNLQ